MDVDDLAAVCKRIEAVAAKRQVNILKKELRQLTVDSQTAVVKLLLEHNVCSKRSIRQSCTTLGLMVPSASAPTINADLKKDRIEELLITGGGTDGAASLLSSLSSLPISKRVGAVKKIINGLDATTQRVTMAALKKGMSARMYNDVRAGIHMKKVVPSAKTPHNQIEKKHEEEDEGVIIDPVTNKERSRMKQGTFLADKMKGLSASDVIIDPVTGKPRSKMTGLSVSDLSDAPVTGKPRSKISASDVTPKTIDPVTGKPRSKDPSASDVIIDPVTRKPRSKMMDLSVSNTKMTDLSEVIIDPVTGKPRSKMTSLSVYDTTSKPRSKMTSPSVYDAASQPEVKPHPKIVMDTITGQPRSRMAGRSSDRIDPVTGKIRDGIHEPTLKSVIDPVTGVARSEMIKNVSR